jgi:hypothetical protein
VDFGSFTVRLGSLLNGVVPPKPHFLFAQLDLGNKPTAIFTDANALHAEFVVGVDTLIAVILRPRSLAQIHPPTIRAVHIDVVDLVSRPFPKHVEKGEAVA